MKPAFRKGGIDKTAVQAKQGAGWLIATSKDSNPATLIDTGRRFQRMLLGIRERGIAVHPMTQVLEEGMWPEGVGLPSGEVPQFLLRVGYLDRYPDPVTPRRPVDWFTTIAQDDA